MINGVLWRTRTGSPWRDLPAEYGLWKTVYHRHRRWSADGTWARILNGLQRDADQDQGPEWSVGVDSTVVWAHQHAAGARGQAPVEFAPEFSAAADAQAGGWVELQASGR